MVNRFSFFGMLAVFFLFFIPYVFGVSLEAHAARKFAGSESCRDCHERFYKLWAPSRHGKAMQPYTPDFAKEHLSGHGQFMQIAGREYRAFVGEDAGFVLERANGKEKRYPIKHVLGGKYVYYFLTPMEKGRLQTLPLGYDVKKREWFDMAGSGIRHVGTGAVDWLDPVYTFNTSCHGCHVSQLTNNYDLKTGEYTTTWNEPGINCETCHGPSSEHNRVFREAPEGITPADPMILGGKGKFSTRQNTDACAPCHAQMVPLTGKFMPGDKFYDHFDLVTLEDPDFYPDGRDLGENYTHTTWSLSPCVQSGELGCLHCHTSSGRFRQKDNPNASCSPCHDDKVKASQKHTMHKAADGSPSCVSCHMHKTTFARMDRSDHSMLPPAPAATIAFGSPNACNGCHTDKNADWADTMVRKWRKRDYQAPVLYRGKLVESARKGDWSRLDEMLAYVEDKESDPIFVTSLIRLLWACPDPAKWGTVMEALNNDDPLVRASAAEALGPPPSHEAVQALVVAAGDSHRLVRIKAAAALNGIPMQLTKGQYKDNLDKAGAEYLASLTARPDLWTSHYNLGNYHLHRREFKQAINAYDTAHGLAPRAVPPLVNGAMAEAAMNNGQAAIKLLEKALNIEPKNGAILFNLGLLEAEMSETGQAVKHLKATLEMDPKHARAAYNLSVLLADSNPQAAATYAQQAFAARRVPAYAFNHAYAEHRAGKSAEARFILKSLVDEWPEYVDAYFFLQEMAESDSQKEEVRQMVLQALSSHPFSRQERMRLESIVN